MTTNGKDPIDQAIATAEQPAVAMQQFNVTVASTGRPAVLLIPQDIADGELAELAGWLLTDVMRAKRAEREKGAASRILVPVGVARPS